MQPPGDLRERGQLFWHEVSSAVELDPSGFVLLGEACRIIDRLDRLSSALNGKGRDWLKLADEIEVVSERFGDGKKISVKVAVDGLLSESRQQQMALKSVLAQLGLGKAEVKELREKSALQQWLEQRSSG